MELEQPSALQHLTSLQYCVGKCRSISSHFSCTKHCLQPQALGKGSAQRGMLKFNIQVKGPRGHRHGAGLACITPPTA